MTPAGLCTAFDLHLQPDGAYEHDSVYSAAFQCSGPTGELHILLYTDDRLLASFPLRFDPEPGLTHMTIFPAVGVEVSCDIECDAAVACDADAVSESDVFEYVVTVDRVVCGTDLL
ncbi:hypothetical protein WJX84_006820 [Apatococcus fuscideae]|uniref:Uncharacterized protein n=1 Tax=Apatococcus fuscideae TaxID=2026836 RepID=A0AAW1T5N7_9CHLO